jgi:hypothetical protein
MANGDIQAGEVKMGNEFYYKITSEVDELKLQLVQKIEGAFRQHIKKTLGFELPPFELKWFLPCTEDDYKKNGIYDRIFRILHELGGPEPEEEFLIEPEKNICGIYRKKHAFSLRLKPRRIIYVRANLSLEETAKTLIHELFHLLQAEVELNRLTHSEFWAGEAERILLEKFQREGLL